MSPLRHLLALAVLGLAGALPVCAELLPVRAYTTADGLPHDRVKRILEDADGFLWFCTTEGLGRFDGRGFATYGVAEGLPVPSLNDMLSAPGGFYLATNGGGIVFFAPAAPRASRTRAYPVGPTAAAARVNALLLDGAGTLWAGTDGGLFRLERAAARDGRAFTPVPLGIEGKADASVIVWTLLEDHGEMLAGTRAGLVRIAAGRPPRVLPISPRGTDQIFALARGEGGRIWVGHEGGGLHAFERRGGELVEVFHAGTAEGLPHDTVRAVLPDGARLLVATDRGLAVVEEGRITAFTPANGLTGGPIRSLARDADGGVWLGTESGGALRLGPSGLLSYHEEDGLGRMVSAIFRRRDGTLLLASTNWLLSAWDGRRFTTVRPRLPPGLDAPRWRGYHGVVEDGDGDLWLGTAEGVYRFAAPRTLAALATAAPKAVYTARDGLASEDVSRLLVDRRGDVWIGTFTPVADALTRWDRASGRFVRYGAGAGLPAFAAPYSLAEDAAGNVWIGYREGVVARFRRGRFEVMTKERGFPPATVTAFLPDAAGRLWATTNGAGLLRVDAPDADEPRARTYGAREGLDGFQLSGLVEGADGAIFVGTSRELLRFDPRTGRAHDVVETRGVVSSELASAYRDGDGTLWLGTGHGVARYVPGPERLRRAPRMRIAAARVSGAPVALSGLGASAVSLGRLAANASVAIEWLAVGRIGEPLLFEHMLAGEDRDWSPARAESAIEFAHLAPGKHRFLVRAAGADPKSAAEVSFVVLPPIWRRWWFVAAVALALGAAGYGLDHARAARQLELERMRTRIASDLHDDIGASLARIAVLSEVVKRQIGAEHGERLDSIAALSRDLVGSMSDIVWATDPRKDQLENVVERVAPFAADLLEPKGIAWSCEVAPEARGLRLAPQARREIYLILKEAVHNVARHSRARRAWLRVSAAGRSAVFEVADDGRGLGAGGGTGVGLVSMRTRARSIGARLDVEPRAEGGTCVRLTL